MTEAISESRFYMWRCVVGIAHADGVVTPHELSFINDYIKHLNFSQGQLDIIGEDLREPKDIYQMFACIEEAEDKRDFFALARALSWCDGDYDAQEELIIGRLAKQSLLSENQEALEDSRELTNEIELCDNQWQFKTERSKKLFGFLNKRQAATA